MAFQVLVIVLFVGLSLAHVFHADGAAGLVSVAPVRQQHDDLAGISAGAAIAAYSFLGFDAVTTLTEETIDPRRTIPRAIMLTALIGGGIFVVVAYTTQLVHPGGEFTDSASAAFDIAQEIGGDLFGSIFLAGLVMAQYASGLAAQASVSRLLFAMGRDNVLPRKFFAFVHPKYHTPVLNLAAQRSRRAAGPVVRPGDVDVVHQLRRLHRLHLRQPVGDRRTSCANAARERRTTRGPTSSSPPSVPSSTCGCSPSWTATPSPSA